MIWNVGLHGADHAKIIDRRTDFWKYFAHFNATLTAFAEGERRLHQIANFSIVGISFWSSPGHLLAIVSSECRFWVEGIYLRPASIHEEKNDILGLGKEMRLPWIKGTPRIGHETA